MPLTNRKVSWFSCGAASAIATKLSDPDVIAYCETGSEDYDNKRFMADCETWFSKEIIILKNPEFDSTWADLIIETPLIDRGITKAACLAMLKTMGVKEPRTYAMGFPNGNCIPCVKATSAAYWALVRMYFPAEFWRMAKISRELGVRLARLNGERIFIDEIPADHPVTQPIAPECDFLCSLAEQEMSV